MTTYEIDIEINSDIWIKQNSNIEALTRSVIQQTLDQTISNIEHIEVSIVLSDNKFIQNINNKYRKKDTPTNVLSFPMTGSEESLIQSPFISLGDIIVAYETIKKEAIEQNKTIENHFTHMLVHGCLHLLHYDHETKGKAIEMESLETKILKFMNIKNPYNI